MHDTCTYKWLKSLNYPKPIFRYQLKELVFPLVWFRKLITWFYSLFLSFIFLLLMTMLSKTKIISYRYSVYSLSLSFWTPNTNKCMVLVYLSYLRYPRYPIAYTNDVSVLFLLFACSLLLSVIWGWINCI